MANEDKFLRNWVEQLTTMQRCMNQVTTDTDLILMKFAVQKHADLLVTAMIRTTFVSAFQNETNIAINDDHFTGSASFRELLDQCYRPLQQAVVVMMRAVAVENDPTLGAITAARFGAVKTAQALSAGVLAGLVQRLDGAMTPLFRAGGAAEAKLRDAIGKPDATVAAAALAVL